MKRPSDILNQQYGVAENVVANATTVRTNPDSGFELDAALLASDLAHETLLSLPDEDIPTWDD